MNLFELMETENKKDELLERYKQLSNDLEKLWNVIRSHQSKASQMKDELTEIRHKLYAMGVKV